MTIPMPPWVSAVGSLSPLILGVAGILVGRKTKTATDEVKLAGILERVLALETRQAEHTILIAKLGSTIDYLTQQLTNLCETVADNQDTLWELRGMLQQMNGQPATPKPRRRPVPALPRPTT